LSPSLQVQGLPLPLVGAEEEAERLLLSQQLQGLPLLAGVEEEEEEESLLL